MKKILFIAIMCTGFIAQCMAQEAVDSMAPAKPKQKITKFVFNSTKIINMQSTEIVGPGYLQFMISHHFGHVWNKDGGAQNVAQLFGLNSGIAHTYLSFDYSPKQWLNVGLAATGNAKFEGWTKIKFLRQQTGAKQIPVSVVLFSLANANAGSDPDHELAANRFSFMNQVLISRKFSDRLSLQIMPTWVHFNIVPYGFNNSNEVFSLGLGGKYKVKDNMNLTFEYSRQFNMYENIMTKNGAIVNYQPDLLSAGIEINTGGHQFQFYIGSTTEASNIDQLSKNTSVLKDGNFALGFTMNRSLSIGK